MIKALENYSPSLSYFLWGHPESRNVDVVMGVNKAVTQVEGNGRSEIAPKHTLNKCSGFCVLQAFFDDMGSRHPESSLSRVDEKRRASLHHLPAVATTQNPKKGSCIGCRYLQFRFAQPCEYKGYGILL